MSMTLQQLSYEGARPFSVKLSNGSMLECTEIVRRVPNKRLVCRAVWNNQAVYAKLFIGAQAARYAQRDAYGVDLLSKAKLTTPALLFAGLGIESASQIEQAQVLIFAEISGGLNAEQAMHANAHEPELRFHIAKKLVAEVAHHHQAGLIQSDLYLKNFLMRDGKVYTLDGDGIQPLSGLFRARKEMHNLAVLISKFDALDQSVWIAGLLDEYARIRCWPTISKLNVVDRLANRHRLTSAQKYADHKVFRNCSDVHIVRLGSDFVALSQPAITAHLLDSLKDPDRLLDTHLSSRFKTGNTCTVSLVEVDHRKLVVKRYNIKSFWHGLGRAFRQTRAAASWANAHRLALLDVATAKPVALYERRIAVIRRQSYFLAEFIDALDAGQFFADLKISQAEKEEVAGNIATLFYKLRLLKISHGDFKASNIKVVDNAPVLIDLDSMRQHTWAYVSERRHVRDIGRFFRNWSHDPVIHKLLVEAFHRIYKETNLLVKAGIKLG